MSKHSTSCAAVQESYCPGSFPCVEGGGAGGVARRGPSGEPPSCIPGDQAGAVREAPATGLSPAHISPQAVIVGGDVTFYCGGGLVEARKTRIKVGQARGGGFRGYIKSFSKQSRRRLLRMVAKMDQGAALPIFLTLTYPGEFPTDAAVWKRHLDNFDKRLARKFPASAAVWKLEFQQRGAPHFHMLIWGISYSELREFTARAWYEVVGSGDEKHLRAGVRVETIRSWRGVRSYAAKYIGKIENLPNFEEWGHVGRIWGVRRPGNIPWAEALTVAVNDRQVSRLFRLLRRYARLRAFGGQRSMSVFVGDASFWAARADGLMGAPF
jgi:hypothetical protein